MKKIFLAAVMLFGIGLVVSMPPSASAAELTTWQKFIQDACGGSSADAAARCASGMNGDLRRECGAANETNRYVTCWRKFIRDNGGTAGASSSPFEGEVPVVDADTDIIEGCGDIKTSIIKCNTEGGNPVMSILLQIINFLAVGVGIAVVGGITWGGMLYASSNGDAGKTKQAITIIVNAVVGLLLFIFMYALINFLVPGGLFT